MKCKDCRDQLLSYVKGELEDPARVEDHVASCAACARELQESRKVLSVVQEAESPVIRELVDRILLKALEERATEIHMQPAHQQVLVRFRVDAALKPRLAVELKALPAIVGRLKLLADVSPAERHAPQTGRFIIRKGESEHHFSLSCVDGVAGPSMVIRLGPPQDEAPTFQSLGLDERLRFALHDVLSRPTGLVVVHGPEGRGCARVMAAIAAYVNAPERAVVTVEDPVTWVMDGATQLQVRPSDGLTVERAVRNALHQCPDALLVGEVPDAATAETLAQAATGRTMVVAALPTPTATIALLRLLGLGLAPYSLAQVLVGVVGLHQVRTLCAACRSQRAPKKSELAWLRAAGVDRPPKTVACAAGCDRCAKAPTPTVALFDVHALTDAERDLVRSGPRGVEAWGAGRLGSSPLRRSLAAKVVEGVVDVGVAMGCAE